MKYLVIITFTILFAGCFTPKKAVDVLSRPKNEPVLAELCSTRFPVIATVDSSAYLASKAKVDSLIAAFDTTSALYESQLRYLIEEIGNLRQVPETDWYAMSQKLSEYATLLEKRNDSLEKQNKKLSKSVKDIQPVKETKPDLAKESVLNSQIAELGKSNRILSEKNADLSHKLVQVSAERDTFKHERNKWKLRFFLLLFGVGLLYAAKVKMTKKLW